MRLVRVENTNQIKEFIALSDTLYKDDANYVPYMKGSLARTLKKLLITDKTYTAFLVYQDKTAVARIIFTISTHKRMSDKGRCGFFSMFECINQQDACNMLFDGVTQCMREQNVRYIEGTYFPYDQDNRRGILVQGFERRPPIFTSYNPPYYSQLLTNYGFVKAFDTHAYFLVPDTAESDKIAQVAQEVIKRKGYIVRSINLNKAEEEIDIVQHIMECATNDVIYQEAPTREDLTSIFKQWRRYLNADFIKILFTKDNRPVGVTIAIPDYNILFQKMKGSLSPVSLLKMLYYKGKIDTVRAIMQYVVPEYQGLGVSVVLYAEMLNSVIKHNIKYVEAGTIMEDNFKSNSAVIAAGGTLCRVYRLYGKDI